MNIASNAWQEIVYLIVSEWETSNKTTAKVRKKTGILQKTAK